MLTTQNCHYCGRENLKTAIKCQYCGTLLTFRDVNTGATLTAAQLPPADKDILLHKHVIKY